MTCFPRVTRDKVIAAQLSLMEEDHNERIQDLLEITGCCETCAKSVCLDALAKLLIISAVKIHNLNAEEAETFESGVIELYNALVEDDEDDDDDDDKRPTFEPSDN
ncbi:MAG: hypothetical protein E6Q97_08070 [Desulfurellales bacterium]|nr:MAG: hypothetical protein E6Q97_08070 [Desulfurellales bacterium]